MWPQSGLAAPLFTKNLRWGGGRREGGRGREKGEIGTLFTKMKNSLLYITQMYQFFRASDQNVQF